MVLQYLTQPYGNTQIKFWILVNTLKYTVKYWVLRIELVSIHNTMKYPRRPLATVDNHMGMHQILLDTFGNPEYSNYLLFKHFLRRTRSSNKRWRPQTICSRASIVFIRTNPTKIQIYRQLLLATQIPSNTQVFYSIWVANIKYWILSNTIWELAFTAMSFRPKRYTKVFLLDLKTTWWKLA